MSFTHSVLKTDFLFLLTMESFNNIFTNSHPGVRTLSQHRCTKCSTNFLLHYIGAEHSLPGDLIVQTRVHSCEVLLSMMNPLECILYHILLINSSYFTIRMYGHLFSTFTLNFYDNSMMPYQGDWHEPQLCSPQFSATNGTMTYAIFPKVTVMLQYTQLGPPFCKTKD